MMAINEERKKMKGDDELTQQEQFLTSNNQPSTKYTSNSTRAEIKTKKSKSIFMQRLEGKTVTFSNKMADLKRVDELAPTNEIEKIKADVHKENQNVLENMSPIEIEANRKELFKIMKPEIIQKLKTNKKVTFVTPTIKETPLTTNKDRFDFSGNLIINTIDLDNKLGLHHHGKDEDRAGYTIEELSILCRSSYQSQKVLALNILSKIILKIRQHKYPAQFRERVISDFVMEKIYIVLRMCLDETNITTVVSAINTLYSLFVGPYYGPIIAIDSSKCNNSNVLSYLSLLNEKIYMFGKEKVENIKEDTDNVEEIFAKDMIAGFLETNLIMRLNYFLAKFKLDYQSIVMILDILYVISNHSTYACNTLLDCDQLLINLIKLCNNKIPVDEMEAMKTININIKVFKLIMVFSSLSDSNTELISSLVKFDGFICDNTDPELSILIMKSFMITKCLNKKFGSILETLLSDSIPNSIDSVLQIIAGKLDSRVDFYKIMRLAYMIKFVNYGVSDPSNNKTQYEDYFPALELFFYDIIFKIGEVFQRNDHSNEYSCLYYLIGFIYEIMANHIQIFERTNEIISINVFSYFNPLKMNSDLVPNIQKYDPFISIIPTEQPNNSFFGVILSANYIDAYRFYFELITKLQSYNNTYSDKIILAYKLLIRYIENISVGKELSSNYLKDRLVQYSISILTIYSSHFFEFEEPNLELVCSLYFSAFRLLHFDLYIKLDDILFLLNEILFNDVIISILNNQLDNKIIVKSIPYYKESLTSFINQFRLVADQQGLLFDKFDFSTLFGYSFGLYLLKQPPIPNKKDEVISLLRLGLFNLEILTKSSLNLSPNKMIKYHLISGFELMTLLQFEDQAISLDDKVIDLLTLLLDQLNSLKAQTEAIANDGASPLDQLNKKELNKLYEGYEKYLNEYLASSYNLLPYGRLLSIPLEMTFPIDFRMLFWSHASDIIHVIKIFPPHLSEQAIKRYFYPIEQDENILKLMFDAFLYKLNRSMGLVYWLVIHHLKLSKVQENVMRILLCRMSKNEIKFLDMDGYSSQENDFCSDFEMRASAHLNK